MLAIDETITATLDEGRTFRFVAYYDGGLCFIRDCDRQIKSAQVGERWELRCIPGPDDRRCYVELVRRAQDALPPVTTTRIDRPVPRNQRHLGEATPSHLQTALWDLPETFEVEFDYFDQKSTFGLYAGVAIRPFCRRRIGREPADGERCLVTPAASGRQGIYCIVLAGLNGPDFRPHGYTRRAEDEELPERFPVTFNERDAEGIFGRYGSFLIRAGREWMGGPEDGETLEVTAVRKRGSLPRLIAYVVPSTNGAPV